MAKTLVEITDRGVITLPKALRGEAKLFEARMRKDGVIELVPQHLIPAAQKWFWSERWQRMEREADADIAAGRVERFGDAEALIAALDRG